MTPTRFLRIAHQRFRAVVRARDLDNEIDRELALHLDQLTKEKQAEGLSPDAARAAARREFGNITVFAERSRDARGLTWLADIRQDAAYGWRMLRGSPGFTTIAAMSLALGIGASAAVAGAIALVSTRSMPFPESHRIVAIYTSRPDGTPPRGGSSRADYLAWRDRSRTLEAAGASLSSPRLIGADPDGAPAEQVSGQAFTPSLFAVLGVKPAAGRLFEETRDPFSKAALVVVISHRLWQRRFAGAPDAIGRVMLVEGARRQIVGIMGPDFRYQDDNVDLWTPLIVVGTASTSPRTDARLLLVTARLRPNVTIAQVRADLTETAPSLVSESDGSRSGWSVRVVPLREALYGWTRPRLLTLAAGAGFILLLTCANVAGLLLARGATRGREVALRLALGATRSRIARQLLTESLVLGLAAGVLGVGVAWMGLSAVTFALGPPPGLPRLGVVNLDAWALAAVLVLSVASAVAFGLAPALAETRLDARSALNALAPTVAGPAPDQRYRGALVSAQVALAEVLLIGAALLSISVVRLSGRELHFDPQGLLTFSYALPAGRFATPLGTERGVPNFQVSELGSQTIQRLYEGLCSVEGAGSVAGISYPPVNSLILPTTTVRVLADGPTAAAHTAAYFLVTPKLFATLRTPVVRGREFDDRDGRSGRWTVVINEAMAGLAWAGDDPIGKHVRIDADLDEQDREVIGVVRNVPTRLDQYSAQPAIYASYLQQPSRYHGRAVGMFGGMTFVMRPAADPAIVLTASRRVVSAVTPDRPLVDVGTVRGHLSARLAERWNYAAAAVGFALAAVLIAVIGIYGMLGYDVNRRAGEIAVRKALGAQARDLIQAAGRPTFVFIGTGLAVGLAISLPLMRLLSPQLWGITASDPLTFAGGLLALAGATLFGCLGPLRRAVVTDPAVRLRSE